MKSGEKIRLITEAVDSLEERNVADAQLVLRTFNAETYDPDFNQEPDRDYFMGRCETLDEDDLRGLHDFLVGEDAALGSNAPTRGIWGDNPVKVFISHRHEDAAFASAVNKILRERHGIDAFVAHQDIAPSAAWRATIRHALSTCDFLVAILHEKFHDSQWCDQEVGWALGRDIPVMPVRRAPHVGQRFDGFMEEHQDLLLAPRHGDGSSFLAQQILENVVDDPRTKSIGLSALIEAFVNSGSYDRTRTTWALIEKQPTLTTEHLRRLEYAVQTNNQVYDGVAEAGKVPDLVKQLVEKFEPAPPTNPWAASPDGTSPF